MIKTRLLGAVSASFVGLLLSHAVWASPVTVTSNDVRTWAGDVTQSFDFFTGTSIPSTDTLTASINNSSSIMNLTYSGTASSTTFAYDFSHGIDNTVGDMASPILDYAESKNDSLYFTATTNTTYSIDGLYGMIGPGTRIYLDAFLYDTTAGVYLFQDYSESRVTANESFVLGVGGDGDFYNSTTGTLTGNLIAGHIYQFSFIARLQAYDGTESLQVAATAAGEVNLNIDAVPAPAAAWLFGSGLLGLIGISSKKRRNS